jgi:hypothetical protein
MPLIAAFNDEIRNAIKGSPDGGDGGYITNGQNIYTVMDGMPRTLTAAWRHIRDVPDADRGDRGRLYWTYLVAMTVGSLGVVALVSDPIRLITILAAITFVFSPLWFVLNTWCVHKFIKDPKMRPKPLDFALAGIGIVFMIGTALLLLYTDVLGSFL